MNRILAVAVLLGITGCSYTQPYVSNISPAGKNGILVERCKIQMNQLTTALSDTNCSTSYVWLGGEGGKNISFSGDNVSLTDAMKGGTLIIRDAFVIDSDVTPEEISIYTPIIETEQFPISENLITNGHFKDGNHVTEMSANQSSTNHEIVEFDNPGHSTWVLKTTAQDYYHWTDGEPDLSNNNYHIELDGITGETYVMSCWVYWSNDWPENRGLFGTSEDASTGGESDSPVETKIVNGKTWYKHYRIVTPTDPDGNIEWYLGKTGIDGFNGGEVRYITDIQYEAGSLTSKPSPYMTIPRTEEIDVQSTGLITFENDTTIKGTFSENDDGFVELMSSDNGDRGTGKIIIKDAIVTDENYEIGRAHV